jgi:hypothetical protein
MNLSKPGFYLENKPYLWFGLKCFFLFIFLFIFFFILQDMSNGDTYLFFGVCPIIRNTYKGIIRNIFIWVLLIIAPLFYFSYYIPDKFICYIIYLILVIMPGVIF